MKLQPGAIRNLLIQHLVFYFSKSLLMQHARWACFTLLDPNFTVVKKEWHATGLMATYWQ